MFSNHQPDHFSPQALRQSYEALYRHGWLSATRGSLGAWLARLLALSPGNNVLDVACGDGQFAIALEKTGAIYYGVDFAHSAAVTAQHPRVLVSDGAYLPFGDNCFDVVTNIGSLEHFQEMAQGVREMARVLRPDGRFCLLVPNAFSLTWNVTAVWRTGHLSDDDGQPLQRFGTRRAWGNLLTANGLTISQTIGYERTWPNGRAEWQLYRQYPSEIILALLAPFIPLNLCRCFVFLGQKGEIRD